MKLMRITKPVREEEDGEGDEGQVAAGMGELDGLMSQEATGSCVFLDDSGTLHWPVLFLYPEHCQTDFISAFCETSK